MRLQFLLWIIYVFWWQSFFWIYPSNIKCMIFDQFLELNQVFSCLRRASWLFDCLTDNLISSSLSLFSIPIWILSLIF
jgi:hypothetical protein